MKKSLLLLVSVVVFLTTSLHAQAIYSDANFLKASNHLFSACYTLDDIVKAENQQSEREKDLPLLKKNLLATKTCYEAIKAKYPKDVQLKKLKDWNDVLQKVIDSLNGENWQSEPMWQLGYSLIKLDLQDMVNQKLK